MVQDVPSAPLDHSPMAAVFVNNVPAPCSPPMMERVPVKPVLLVIKRIVDKQAVRHVISASSLPMAVSVNPAPMAHSLPTSEQSRVNHVAVEERQHPITQCVYSVCQVTMQRREVHANNAKATPSPPPSVLALALPAPRDLKRM